ncbi:hypothetical protein APT65_11620 [Klebsiella pneumoniae]|nr:hypothetical protein APT65_11620 [Klebsiella pneumoniae]
MNPFRRSYAVWIPADGYYADGEWREGGMTETSAFFSVQSIKNTQEIEHLPEGRRIDDYRRLYSSTLLPMTGDKIKITESALETADGVLQVKDSILFVNIIVDGGDMTQPAQIIIDGYKYELTHREPWRNGIINHYKYYCVRKYDG